jgi:hypothetical protein
MVTPSRRCRSAPGRARRCSRIPGKLARRRSICGRRECIWQNVRSGGGQKSELQEKADKDKRFNAPEWRDNPLFDMIRQSYVLISDRLLGSVDAIEGITTSSASSCASPRAASSMR